METGILRRRRNGKLRGSMHLFAIVILSHVFINTEHNQIRLKRQLSHKQFLEQTDAYNNKGRWCEHSFMPLSSIQALTSVFSQRQCRKGITYLMEVIDETGYEK
jgi:hypothetical protein